MSQLVKVRKPGTNINRKLARYLVFGDLVHVTKTHFIFNIEENNI